MDNTSRTHCRIFNFLLLATLVEMIFCLTAGNVQAHIFESSSSMALGGAGRAAVVPADINFLNPATLVHSQGRNFFSGVGKESFLVGISEGTGDIILPASFAMYQDSRDSLSALTSEKVKVHEMSLAVGDFITRKLAVGASLHRYVIVWPELFGTKTALSNYELNYLDLGFIYTPSKNWGVGLVFYNLIQKEGDSLQNQWKDFNIDPSKLQDLEIKNQMAIASHYLFRNFLRLRMDFISGQNNTFTENSTLLGMEQLYNEFYMIRLGYQYEGIKHRNLGSVGVGFKGPRFGLNYAYQQDMAIPEIYKHSLDLQIPF